MISRFLSALQSHHAAREARRFLAENHVRRCHAPLDVERMFRPGQPRRRIVLLVEREELHGRAFFLESLGAEIVHGFPPQPREGDVAVCFGYTALERHAARLRRSGISDVLFMEAGFLRSVLLDNSSSVYDQAICFFVDDLGFHFDATVPTRIESLLSDPAFRPAAADLARAAALRRRIVKSRLTKYNDQSMAVPLPPKRAERVLVIEQARSDWAVLKSGGSRRSFDGMLQAAVRENPGAEILVKVHPDSLDGKRGGMRRSYFGRMEGGQRITIIKEKVNPFSLLESIDRVYVFSSMLGFEAALMGKEVHVFGKPCYAGWGVTKDRQRFSRRTHSRSLDEIVFAIYFAYQKYKNLQGDWCSPEDAVGLLLELRDRFVADIEGRRREAMVQAAA